MDRNGTVKLQASQDYLTQRELGTPVEEQVMSYPNELWQERMCLFLWEVTESGLMYVLLPWLSDYKKWVIKQNFIQTRASPIQLDQIGNSHRGPYV